MELHAQIIKDRKNKPVAVVLPYDEFQQLMDDMEDDWLNRLADEAEAEPGEDMPFDVYLERRYGTNRKRKKNVPR